jgi:CRP/FNR family transcriptional regulator, cyclic AMP receptor protein
MPDRFRIDKDSGEPRYAVISFPMPPSATTMMAEARSRDAAGDIRRAALQAIPLFQILQPQELESVVAHASVRRYARGEVMLRKGDPGNAMIVILQGRVRISSMSEDGREIILGVLGPGEVLGEIALLDGQERSADASALQECVVVVVERSHFLRLLHGSPDLSLRLMMVLCGRLRRLNLAMEDIALLDLPSRLAKLLLRLARDCGSPGPRQLGRRIEVKLSQKDLSNLVGASREKVNRQLRVWEQDGIIATDQGYLIILQPERLAPAA